MDFKKNYYEVLEIPESAELWQISAAYKKLVKKYHPDKNPGNQEYEELTKEINEAKDVLLNKVNKRVYDEYRKSVNEIQKNSQDLSGDLKNYKENSSKSHFKRKHTKKKTVVTETRVYIKGEISIKYYAFEDFEKLNQRLNEFYYKIVPTEIIAKVKDTDLYKTDTPPFEFEYVFKNNSHFKPSINVPINCIVNSKNGDDTFDLEILDLTIPSPTIEYVSKYEGKSFGTLVGVFYGYVKNLQYNDVFEEVEECFGPTGKIETKFENGNKYKREEFYKADCTKYWSEWHSDYVCNGNSQNGKSNYSSYKNSNTNGCLPSGGCLSYGFSPLIFLFYISLFFISLPSLLPNLLFFGLIFLLSFISKFSDDSSTRTRASKKTSLQWIINLFIFIFLLFFFINIFTKFSYKPPSPFEGNHNEKQKQKIKVIQVDSSKKKDTLITTFRRWKDYDGIEYQGSYSILSSRLLDSKYFKNTLNLIPNSPQNYDRIIYEIKNHDSDALKGVYALFDSLKRTNNFTHQKFAEVIVSFIQDIPYVLILDKECNPLLYNDKFIKKYLQSSYTECDPNEKYGINTPLEFLSTLKGDCDTRTLLLYTILSHYNFDTVLLSSEQYGHSLIGINLPISGLSFDYNNVNYVLWETTASNIRPGLISSEVSNTNYWRISLKSN